MTVGLIEGLHSHSLKTASRWLSRSMAACFGAMVIGQLAFALFIALFYYPSTLTGNLAAWNTKPLITGHVPGDGMGNAAFAFHVLGAGLMTVSGWFQFLPAIRRRWPALHRWNGRFFLLSSSLIAINGLLLVWVRGSWLTLAGGLGVSFNGLIILICGARAFLHARARDFAAHRRWAIRLFVAASGVWFIRIFYMAWGITTGGIGIEPRLSGPFDQIVAFANTLLPLAVLELYFRAERARSALPRYSVAFLLALSAVVILGGSAGAWLVMWSPYI
ncbi:DUF2306 domain-containing protein [Sphingomonas daechungensis]|uniref:DUF2306 domain-containing protein n=1 Tax=Sphingomonas daechungensis TaxID=1176646 RepID=UPI003784E4E6